MADIEYFEIGKKVYPMNFSLGAIKAIQKRFGSVDKMQDALKEQSDNDDMMDAITFMMALLIKQGALYLNTFGDGLDIPDNVARNAEGMVRSLTEEEVELAIGLTTMDKVMDVFSLAMESGQHTEIEIEDGGSKNVEGTLQV